MLSRIANVSEKLPHPYGEAAISEYVPVGIHNVPVSFTEPRDFSCLFLLLMF
jgi:hypothetical protein